MGGIFRPRCWLRSVASGGRSLSPSLSATPLIFDPSHEFKLELGAHGQVVAVALKHTESLQLDAKSTGKLKAMGCVLQSPLALSVPRRVPLVAADVRAGRALYIGVGSRAEVLKRSSWAAPLQSGPGLNRRQAIELYERTVVAGPALLLRLWELDGATLLCHCAPDQRCHGDVLIRLFKGLKVSAQVGSGFPPPSDAQVSAAAALKKASVKQSRVSAAIAARQRPTRICGTGDPIYIGSGDRKRLLADGAGLCSPGLWPPERRHPLKGVAPLLHRAFSSELDTWAKTVEGFVWWLVVMGVPLSWNKSWGGLTYAWVGYDKSLSHPGDLCHGPVATSTACAFKLDDFKSIWGSCSWPHWQLGSFPWPG